MSNDWPLYVAIGVGAFLFSLAGEQAFGRVGGLAGACLGPLAGLAVAEWSAR